MQSLRNSNLYCTTQCMSVSVLFVWELDDACEHFDHPVAQWWLVNIIPLLLFIPRIRLDSVPCPLPSADTTS